ncbi:MAG: helix-turn-helix domain-containing protein [Dehalococcoidia bacterium]
MGDLVPVETITGDSEPVLAGTETTGSLRLRQLRRQAGKTQLWVEAEAELGSGYLQRLESGNVAQPERPTLSRILAALETRYSEQREVLELFGYSMATPPPAGDDIVWAGIICRRDLDEVAFPAYVLDCMHRLIAWNRHFAQFMAVPPDDPLLRRLEGHSLLAPWFDPDSPLAKLVAEPETFLPALIRALRYEHQQFRTEQWYAVLLAQLIQDLPCFRHYWTMVQQEPSPASAARARVPVRLIVPGAGILQFRLSAEPFVRDARFRLIYYLPADPATMRWCVDCM